MYTGFPPGLENLKNTCKTKNGRAFSSQEKSRNFTQKCEKNINELKILEKECLLAMCAKILFDLILLGMPALIFADSVTVMDNGLLRLIYKNQVVFLHALATSSATVILS